MECTGDSERVLPSLTYMEKCVNRPFLHNYWLFWQIIVQNIGFSLNYSQKKGMTSSQFDFLVIPSQFIQ